MSILNILKKYRAGELAALFLTLFLLAGYNTQLRSGEVQTAQIPAQQEITLSVPGMDCPMCPITVRKALEKVDGVSKVQASLKTKEVHVMFDPAQTGVKRLITVIENSGFSTSLKNLGSE